MIAGGGAMEIISDGEHALKSRLAGPQHHIPWDAVLGFLRADRADTVIRLLYKHPTHTVHIAVDLNGGRG